MWYRCSHLEAALLFGAARHTIHVLIFCRFITQWFYSSERKMWANIMIDIFLLSLQCIQCVRGTSVSLTTICDPHPKQKSAIFHWDDDDDTFIELRMVGVRRALVLIFWQCFPNGNGRYIIFHTSPTSYIFLLPFGDRFSNVWNERKILSIKKNDEPCQTFAWCIPITTHGPSDYLSLVLL